jgi:uncharacterized repeat protein (TIGR01451 family)
MLLHRNLPLAVRQVALAMTGALCSLVLVSGLAWAGLAPAIDGNGDDLITYGAAIGDDGCTVDLTDARDDIVIADPEILPCATLEDTDGNAVADYYVNGKDLRRFVAVSNTTTNQLFLLWRAEGFIGDVDGNTNPDNALCVPAANFPDQVGIGSEDSYEARLDIDCDGNTDIIIAVTNNAVSVTGASFSGSEFAYRIDAGSGASGKDLELRIDGINLPPVFRIFGFSGAIRDGLGEDITREETCGVANPDILIEKTAEPASICPGENTVFTLVVTNTGNVTLDPVNVSDTLPAGLSFVEVVSNTCGGAVSSLGQVVSVGPFALSAGQSCTIQIRASATESCIGEVINSATATGAFQSPCVNEGKVQQVSSTDTAPVVCNAPPCATVDAACEPARACPGTPVTVRGTVTNCGTSVADLSLTIEGETRTFDDVPAGESRSFDKIVTMPSCTDGALESFDVSGFATTECASSTPDTDNCTVECDTPQIEIEKSVSPSGPVDQGTTLTYTITVTNPSKDVAAENVVVTDVLCDESTFQGNANPAPSSAPAIGSTGTIEWNLGTIAPGGSAVITFDARIRELDSPDCERTDRECTNEVSVVATCGDAEARDSFDVTTPILPCVQTGICRLTGGGCLNEDGGNRGHKQSTFGGNSSPFHEGGGPTGNEWQHVYRDGREILFNFHSHDAHVIECSVVSPGPCSPPAENTRADFVGTGKYSLGAGSREEDGNMVAYIIDHREGSCNRNDRDYYSIVVRTGLVIGQGTVVFETEGEIDCGNLQIHETPARLFGNGVAPAPVGQIGAVEDGAGLALLNRAVPNPFTGSMSYAYEVVGADQPVDIGVYNVAGRLVKSLAKSTMPAGRHTATWNGTDEGGARVSSGVYFVRVRLGAETQQHRVIFLGK